VVNLVKQTVKTMGLVKAVVCRRKEEALTVIEKKPCHRSPALEAGGTDKDGMVNSLGRYLAKAKEKESPVF